MNYLFCIVDNMKLEDVTPENDHELLFIWTNFYKYDAFIDKCNKNLQYVKECFIFSAPEPKAWALS